MTITRIAELAGVSTSAVSIALNNKSGVSQETRDKILRIAREIGYKHHGLMQQHGSLVVRILGFVDELMGEDMSRSPFFFKLVSDVEREARAAGFDCMFSTAPVSEAAKRIDRLAADDQGPGTLLLGTNLSDDLLVALGRGPGRIVVLDTLAIGAPVDSVVMNNRQGMAAATRKLIDLGHTRIGYCYGKTRISNFLERESGFHDELRRAGLQAAEHDRVPVSSDINTAQHELARWLARRSTPLPTALVCENDYMAIGALRAIAAAGHSVPGDISVTGFDDIAESAVTTPDLTTVNVSTREIARAAIARLLDGSRTHDALPIKQIIDTRLIVRGSTAAPAKH
ncbi:MAG: LacI family transcriptional regulator [Alphaproteobacteria bacterium]|nr:LacI family transcriptional regulator [Alphaproteobacteria bacterium]